MRLVGQVSCQLSRIDWRRPDHRLRLALLFAALVMAGAAYLLRNQISLVQAGYGGIAIAALIASAAFVLPVPAQLAVCAGGVWLNPIVVGMVAGTAEAVGELTGYFLGYAGQGAVNRSRWYQRVEPWMQKRGWLLLLLVSLVPNPVFDVVGLAAGAVRYPVWRFLAVVLVGKTLKFLTVAHVCAYSMDWAIDLLI